MHAVSVQSLVYHGGQHTRRLLLLDERCGARCSGHSSDSVLSMLLDIVPPTVRMDCYIALPRVAVAPSTLHRIRWLGWPSADALSTEACPTREALVSYMNLFVSAEGFKRARRAWRGETQRILPTDRRQAKLRAHMDQCDALVRGQLLGFFEVEMNALFSRRSIDVLKPDDPLTAGLMVDAGTLLADMQLLARALRSRSVELLVVYLGDRSTLRIRRFFTDWLSAQTTDDTLVCDGDRQRLELLVSKQ